MPVTNNGVLDGVRRIGGRFRDLIVDGGLPGAPLGFRLRGATQYGPPQTGTWRTGDVIPDRYGNVLVCTAGGTPGSWAGPVAAVFPTGDTYGKKDPANVLRAIAANGFAYLAPGIYYGASTVGIGLNQAVQGAAKPLVTWRNVGSVPGFTLENSGSYAGDTPAALTGIRIDGSGASAGASAFQAGDIVGLDIDAWVSNWTGGSTAAHFLNAYYWTEEARVRLRISNCDNGIKLDQSGSGTNSYDRCEFDLKFNQNAAQNGIVFAGATQGVVLLEGVLKMRGNWTNSTSALTSSVVSFTTANAGIQSSRLEWGLEVDGTGTHSPQTINFKDSSTIIQNCGGNIEFLNNGNTFAASNNNGNFWFDGPVNGDTTLLKGILSPPNNVTISSGFPTGWAGNIYFQVPRGDGMVFALITLNVTSGTVMTAGETIVASGLPSWAIPTDTRYITADINGTYCSFLITSGGVLKYAGPARTSGGDFPYGQGWYRNSA